MSRQSRREQRVQFFQALPSVVESGPVMDETDASAAMVDLEDKNPAFAELPGKVADTVFDEITPELEQDVNGNFVVSPDELRGMVISRTAIRAVVEAADDIGRELFLDKESENLSDELVGLPTATEPEDPSTA